MKKILLLIALLAIMALVAWLIFSTPARKATSPESDTDYAIEDTSTVGKIFIADDFGRTILLERTDSTWLLNNSYPAREDAVQLLLKTFKNIYVQRPVAVEARETVNKMMAASSKKVEIYDRQGRWIKTWYVGHGTMDKKGTHMLLETPDYGKASAPYIMDMKGFIGMLNTRFFTDENEWRSTVIMRYEDQAPSRVEVRYPGDSAASFAITHSDSGRLALFSLPSGSSIAPFDTARVRDYLLNFKLVSFSNYKTGLSPAERDSILRLQPYQVITVTGPRGEQRVRLWPKAIRPLSFDSSGVPILDQDRVYAQLNSGEIAIAQRFMWDKFRAPRYAFTLPKP